MSSRTTTPRSTELLRVATASCAALLVTALVGCGTAAGPAAGTTVSPVSSVPVGAAAAGTGTAAPNAPGSMTMDQTMSDQAQLTTIAFDGLAFLTGSLGADSFFPPGKVADWWGFQYLRDNDPSGMGHNTDFLTKAALNMLNVLSTEQRAQLVTLAKGQVDQINEYGYDRFALMTAFRRLDSGEMPSGVTGLSEDAVKAYSAKLYQLDGTISLARAKVMGLILAGLSDAQKATLATMVGQGMTSWPNATEPEDLKALSGDEKVAVMTYAGDLFSWYAGSVTADVYFCPERQGTYFGSFYMKDAPAVGNPGYSIGTNITGDMGKAFVAALTSEQAALVTGLVSSQRASLEGIVSVREKVATELRKYMSGGTADEATVQSLMAQYGELDGEIVYQYATAFAKVGDTLTDAQRTTLAGLRTQTLGSYSPKAAYLYSHEIAFPTVTGTDSLFGVGTTSPTVTPAASSGTTPTPGPNPGPTGPAPKPAPTAATVTLSAAPTSVARAATVTATVKASGAGTVRLTSQPAGSTKRVVATRTLTAAGSVALATKVGRTTVLQASFTPAGSTRTVWSGRVTVTVR